MIRRPPRSTRTDTLFPYPTLFRSALSRCRTDRNRLRADGYLSAFDQFLMAPLDGLWRHPGADRAGQEGVRRDGPDRHVRSEEHTSELQSLMRISYAVFCLKKKSTQHTYATNTDNKHTKHSSHQNHEGRT